MEQKCSTHAVDEKLPQWQHTKRCMKTNVVRRKCAFWLIDTVKKHFYDAQALVLTHLFVCSDITVKLDCAIFQTCLKRIFLRTTKRERYNSTHLTYIYHILCFSYNFKFKSVIISIILRLGIVPVKHLVPASPFSPLACVCSGNIGKRHFQ